MNLITQLDEEAFRRRYRGPQCEGSLTYAKRTANEYAEQHAGGMPEWVRLGVAALHFRYCYTLDTGDRQLIRIGIDTLLAVGGACHAQHSSL